MGGEFLVTAKKVQGRKESRMDRVVYRPRRAKWKGCRTAPTEGKKKAKRLFLREPREKKPAVENSRKGGRETPRVKTEKVWQDQADLWWEIGRWGEGGRDKKGDPTFTEGMH